ncbi:MAG: YCF48-related protein [Terriglobia bacterium]
MHGLPKIVLERLKTKPAAPGSSGGPPNAAGFQGLEHPDANFLAAFVEKTLTERERTQVLNHLAQCAECRELTALSLPRDVEVAQPVSLTARRWWSAWPTLRWGALAAALGAAAIVMVLHSYPLRRQKIAAHPAGAETKQRVTLMAAARPPVAVEAKNIPTTPRAREISRGESATSAGPLSSPPPPAKPAFKPSVASEDTLKAEIGAESQADATAVPAKTESAAASQELNAAQAGGISAPRSTPPAPRAAASIRVGSRLTEPSRMAFGGNLNRAVAPVAALWSISTSGKLQRSQDSGRTWEEVRVDDAVTFRAVLAMGRDVWAGGSALYHSSDGGAMWKRVNLSSGESPTTETIVSITSGSRDLQHITVRTESGEQWTTEDGGQHWQRQP